MTAAPSEGTVGGSFRDPSGFVFRRDGQLFRQVNQAHARHYEALMSSGLYQRLVGEGLLVAHEEVEAPPADERTAYKIIRPTLVPFVSYPYEWCFSQLKQAALLTLRIQKLALDHNLCLRDASAYNIQFAGSRPVLIDTLSFEVLREGRPWVAYRQFCQHFLAPLALMAYCDCRLGRMLQVQLDGIPLDLASRMLPRRTWLRPALALHIHVHARAQHRYADRVPRPSAASMGKAALYALADSLAAAVEQLRWRPSGSVWEQYGTETSYSREAAASKREIVSAWLARLKPREVWDLGANVGVFSRLAVASGALTIALDADHGAVERNYLEALSDREERLLPLWIDLTNPSPGLGWQHAEREALAERGPADLVMALALIHHLAIGNNVPLGMVAEFLHLVGRNALVEFVPKSDPQVQRMLAAREDVFANYDVLSFEEAFGKRFTVAAREPIRGSERMLYLMKRRTVGG